MSRRYNRGDRIVAIILIVLILTYVVYAGITSKGIPHFDYPTPTDTLAYRPSETKDDTIPPDTTPPAAEKWQAQTTQAPIHTDRYPGPPVREKVYFPKLKPGATVDLNAADTTLLKRVPGIGSSFARRIVKYRELLGGYYVVEQLQEVYGMDRERYDQIYPYFVIRTGVRPLLITIDSISYHPYLQWRHKKVLQDLLDREEPITWETLMSSGAFSQDDSLRLAPYMPF